MKRRRIRSAGIMLMMFGALITHLSGCALFDDVHAVLVATPIEGVMPLTVEFGLGQTNMTGEGASFFLEFGDGTPFVQGDDFGLAIPHVYASSGTFIAQLSVIDADGKTDRDEVEIVVSSGVPDDGAWVGDMAYDFTAPTTDGSEVTLSGLRGGQVVLIEFWGSWCTPCKESMPHINDLWEDYHEQGLVVLAVSTDEDPLDSVQFLESNGFDGLICIWEPGEKSTRIKLLYEVTWIPRSIVIDKQGIVRYNGHPMELEASVIAALLDE